MNARDLSQSIKTLTKAVEANEPASAIITILETLRKEAAPSEELLRSTKAGITVGKLRSHGSKDVGKMASEIVGKWKKGVDAEKAKKAQLARVNSPSSTPISVSSPAPGAVASNKPYTGDTEKRTFQIDKVDYKRTGNAVRDGVIGTMYNGLAYRSTDSPEDVLLRAIEVENAAFKHFKGDGQPYRMKMRGLYQNLKVRNNRQLGRRVMSGEITGEQFVTMSSEELASEEQRAKDKELEKENMKKAQVPMAEKSISDALKCGKCGQKKVSYSQAQTRSADEPMTTFCECTVCGNRWKFS